MKNYIKIVIILFIFASFLFGINNSAYGCLPTSNKINTYNSCDPVSCQSAPGVYQAYITYQYDDRSYCTQLEYFSNSSCTVRASFTCSGSCTSDSDCGEGTCAGGNADVTSVCTNLNRGSQPYYCQGYNCGYTCNTSNYTCSRVPAGVGQGSSQSYCISSCVAPTATPTPTPPPPTPPPQPTCNASANTTSKTVTATGSNLSNNLYYGYEFAFSPGGSKLEYFPPETKTVSYSDIADAQSVTVEAIGFMTPNKPCGSANLTGGSCDAFTTTCSVPGQRTDQCGVQGLCGTVGPPYICQDCAPPGGWTCNPSLSPYSASCAADGSIAADASPSYGTDMIQFRIKNSLGNTSCDTRGMQSSNRGTPTYPWKLWWAGNGCGTVANDIDLTGGYTWENAATTNYFDSSTIKRGEYSFDSSVGGFWLSNGRVDSNPGDTIYEGKCEYTFNCKGTKNVRKIPGGTLRLCETNYGDGSNFVKPGTVTYECANKDVITMNFETNLASGLGQGRLMYPAGNYPSALSADTEYIQTYLCVQQQASTCGAGESCNTANSSNGAWRPNGGYACSFTRNDPGFPGTKIHTFRGIPSDSGDFPNKSFKGVVGNTYSVEISSSTAHGACAYSVARSITCEGYSITGKVYWDYNGNKTFDFTDADYTSPISLTSSGGSVYLNNPSNGKYKIKMLNDGNTYNVTLADITATRVTTPNPAPVIIESADKVRNFGIAPYRKITGNIFIDKDNDGIYEPGAPNNEVLYTDISKLYGLNLEEGAAYQAGIELVRKNDPDPGKYEIARTTASNTYSYKVSFSSPDGYMISSGQPNSFSGLTVGSECSISASAQSKGASCDANGNIINLNFGISSKSIWFQGKGGDMRIDDGFDDPITIGANPPYVSLDNSNGTPGVIFTGDQPYDFCNGPETINSTSCRSSSKQWVAGGISNPELFPTAKIKASYSYMRPLIARSLPQGQSIINLNTIPTCTEFTNCTLPSDLAPGVYEADLTAIPGKTLVLNVWTPSLTNSDYVFLINGNLGLGGNISIPSSSGNTASFFVSEDIYVDSTLGVAANNSTTFNFDGIYSAGKNFVLEHDLSKSCPTEDKRLNMRGTIIVNAGLQGGSLENSRDLCNNSIYPSLYISERPDFLLNLPSYVMPPNRIWREVAP